MSKNHKADSFEGGRAASLIEPVDPPDAAVAVRLSRIVKVRAESGDDDARALALAIMNLTTDND